MEYSSLLRIVIFLLGVYIVVSINPIIGVFVIITGFFSFSFSLRQKIFLTPSPRADYWEFFVTLLVLVNAFMLASGAYNNSFFFWVDIPMHIAGGMLVAWWASLAFRDEFLTSEASVLRRQSKFKKFKSLIVIIAVVALIGVSWEMFEWTFDHTVGARYSLPPAQVSNNDTMKDLADDVLGGAIIALFVSRKKEHA